jgi:hypothetical protein
MNSKMDCGHGDILMWGMVETLNIFKLIGIEIKITDGMRLRLRMSDG